MQRPEPTNIEREVRSVELIVSKSDEKGDITYMNPMFVRISGYSQGELMESPHSILRHPDMPKVIFKYLWDNIQEGRDIVAFVKNLCKDGAFYWVLASVKVAKNPDGSFRNYMSTRKCITDTAKQKIALLYTKLLEIEKSDGVEASQNALMEFLSANGVSDNVSFNNLMTQMNT
jgi:PAS domain S-box-containing protein